MPGCCPKGVAQSQTTVVPQAGKKSKPAQAGRYVGDLIPGVEIAKPLHDSAPARQAGDMYERFTDHARKVMQLANQEAQRLNHQYIGTEHVLLGLIDQGDNTGITALKNLGVDLPALREEVERAVQAGANPLRNTGLPQAPRAKKVIEYAMDEANWHNHDHVGTEHILLGLLREQEGIAAQVLRSYGLQVSAVRAEIVTLLSAAPSAPAGPVSDFEHPQATAKEVTNTIGRARFNYEHFTDRARKVIQLANQEAHHLGHEYVGTEHLLLGLIKEGQGVAATVLKNSNLSLRTLRGEVEKLVQRGGERVVMGRLPQTPRAKKVLEDAIQEADRLNHNYVGTEHLLLGMLHEREGVAAQVLTNIGLTLHRLREETVRLLAGGIRATAMPSTQPGRRQIEIEDIPAKLEAAVTDFDVKVKRCELDKQEAVARQYFQKAASLRDEADDLRRARRTMLREWLATRSLAESCLSWSDGAVAKLAQAIAEKQWWSLLPRLADWLEQAGCTDSEILNHCREPGEHASQCWVVDLLLSSTDSNRV